MGTSNYLQCCPLGGPGRLSRPEQRDCSRTAPQLPSHLVAPAPLLLAPRFCCGQVFLVVVFALSLMCFWCPDNSGEGLGLGVWEGEGGRWRVEGMG